MNRLPELGFALAAPMDGAFYAFCDVSRLTNDSMAFARRMLAEAHVAATPGRDFDPLAGHRFMRFSYAGSHDDMVEAMDRIERWLRIGGHIAGNRGRRWPILPPKWPRAPIAARSRPIFRNSARSIRKNSASLWRLIDGRVIVAGDADEPFSIQSVSKVFTLTLALGKVGDALWKRVGREPSGNPFNSIVQLEQERGIPRNPFINAGAIVVSDVLLAGHQPREAIGEILRFIQFLADDDTHLSSIATWRHPSGRRVSAISRWPTTCARSAISITRRNWRWASISIIAPSP